MNASRSVFLLLCATIAASPFAAEGRPAPARKPNILFLLADDMRADTIAAYGNTHIKPPNLDGPVRRGFNFRGNPKIGHLQSFDLRNDPHETTNMNGRPRSGEHVARLMKLMKQWQARVGDTVELPAENKQPPAVDLTGCRASPINGSRIGS